MSHRIRISSEIKDKELVKSVLKNLGVTYTEQGNHIYLTSGIYKGTSIDTQTGTVTSEDTDRISVSTVELDSELGLLRQHYAEALQRNRCALEGHEIQNRTVETINNEQCVVLYCRMP